MMISRDCQQKTKVCPKCNLEKSSGEFYPMNRRGKRYLKSYCKACDSAMHKEYYKKNTSALRSRAAVLREHNRSRIRESAKRSYEKHREERIAKRTIVNNRDRERYLSAHRNYKLKSKYGIDSTSYEAMLAEQLGSCKICGGDGNGRRLVVDHDHTSGKIRGLLCNRCNQFIGMIGDNPSLAIEAALYLVNAKLRTGSV
jgi:hypothetical protein